MEIAELLGVQKDKTFVIKSPSICDLDEVLENLAVKVRGLADSNEFSFVFVYYSGHGVARQQYQCALLNSFPEVNCLYPLEEKVRSLSAMGRGNCHVLAVYDTCRIQTSYQTEDV